MKKIISVVGARPNFIKIAPLDKVFKNYSDSIIHLICHTGQHFDKKMSKIFFDELEMPKPDFYLGIGGGSHATQTAKIMIEFEQILLREKPDIVIVPGDVNSTLAASLTASKMHIPVAHVESGLRSFDMKMPEEVNRILTDKISDLLFVTEESGLRNLQNEGFDTEKIFFTGNIMIDSLVQYLPKINKSNIVEKIGLKNENYILSTFHRPSNVDDIESLKQILEMFYELAEDYQIVFPVHPRTKNKIKEFGLEKLIHQNMIMLEPLGYIDFLSLTKNASLVITDSGGIQEETTFLGIQCITVRETTERPITCDIGTNQLIGVNLSNVYNAAKQVLDGSVKKGSIPKFWDGHTANRIGKIINNFLFF